ncbi:hypothetical protein SAMN05216474_2711 [Lishizhenia tianjinensis]|uniref:Uncharacterized protein n=1 Tax=Lishizhenia tianjinensis TaxID=477690 RepID=A0A1I7BDU7_9FLAO|nr:hypothetical protein [Lishizhenia tianjinensis]SFT85328.1 hypothetical protein SAMN05216474_2711 [Lishizhenia tianjinensis]
MKKQNLKARHFLLAYLACLVSSIFLAIPINGSLEAIGMGLIAAVVALITSLPFIIIFLALMYYRLQKENSKMGLHLFTFVIHTAGAFLTILAFYIFGSSASEFSRISLLIVGYYVLDSIYFHALIQVRFKAAYDVEIDTLDSFGESKEIEF